jgi:hypothetical protein
MAHFSKISLDCILTFVLLGVDLKKTAVASFLMDNDPSQTKLRKKRCMENIDAKFLKTPARSPDLNPIENTFHLVKKSLDNQALANNITSGTFIEFPARVLKSMENLSTEIIDRTIASRSNRVDAAS